MFTIEEKKQIRNEFWSKFKAYSNRRKLKANKNGKWILDQTGIKQVKLKLHIDENSAWAGIEIDTKNLEKRIELFDKLEKLNNILSKEVPYPLIWELEIPVVGSKTVSRVYSKKEEVSIYDKTSWNNIFIFFYDVMFPIENVFLEYFDFLKY